MSKVQIQHYVPQFYLKHFTHNGEQLHVFDKPSKTSFPTHVRNIGGEKHFYDIPAQILDELRKQFQENLSSVGDQKIYSEILALLEDPQAAERTLSRMENRFSDVFNDFLGRVNEQRSINGNLRRDMATLIAVQALRTHEQRKAIVEINEKMTRVLIDIKARMEGREWSSEDFEVEFNPDLVALKHLQFMFNPRVLNMLTTILNSHIWLIGFNRTSQPLYTSDEPLVLRPHLQSEYYSNSGFGSSGIEIAFPLTPKHVLIMAERTYFQHRAGHDGGLTFLNEDNVIYYNSLQVFQSRRQIYCVSDQFDLALEICTKHPDTCDVNQQTMTAHWNNKAY